ncbi:MAG: Na+/H+ antiporter subunit E [Porticoccaceae bacterium]|jgi:multicomponent Na+:H+ antiporter subunit E
MLLSVLVRGGGLVMLWWVLTEGNMSVWWLGAIAVIIALLVSIHLLPPSSTSIRLSQMPVFVVYFAWNSILGGIRVSLSALRFRPKLHPTVVEFDLRLPTGGCRVLLLGTASLMPGTLGINLNGDKLHLHVLDETLNNTDSLCQLENRIARLFGIAQ